MLSLINVTKGYRLDDVECLALRGVSVTFAAGACTAIVGSSGSGKSTLLHVAGLIDEPSGGEILFGSQNLCGFNDTERTGFRRDHFGFIFQSYHLIPVLTCIENVRLPSKLKGEHNPRVAQQRAQFLLESVGLADHIHKNIRALSGGQRQRVAIARALMNEPKIIFADEPTANLDQVTGEKVLGILSSLCRTHGTTLVICTHDTKLLHFADSVVTLSDGKRI